MEGAVRQTDLPSVAALAYLGDAVHSLDIRRRAVAAGHTKSGTLHAFSAGIVNAAVQAAMLRHLLPQLSEEEAELVRRAANKKHLKPPKHASAKDYQEATAFEALLGMLSFLGREERLRALLDLSYEYHEGTKGELP